MTSYKACSTNGAYSIERIFYIEHSLQSLFYSIFFEYIVFFNNIPNAFPYKILMSMSNWNYNININLIENSLNIPFSSVHLACTERVWGSH